MFKTFIMSLLLSERFWEYLIDGVVALFKDATRKDYTISKILEKADNEDVKEILIKSAEYLRKETDNTIDDTVVSVLRKHIN
jgi:hypothetical protein